MILSTFHQRLQIKLEGVVTKASVVTKANVVALLGKGL